MQESTRARREIQARLRSICARGGAVLSITAAVVALMMVGWGVGSAGAAADGDKPIEEIVVIAKRLTCEDGWACIDRKNPWFRMVMRGIQIPSTLFGPQDGGGGAPPEEDEEEEEEEDEDGFCWRDLTAMPGARVSGPFNEPRASGPHKGLDIAVPTGTAVYAARSGVVDRVRSSEEAIPENNASERAKDIEKKATYTGNYVRIVYDDGASGRYLHLKQNSVFVKPGQRVSAGDKIAESNRTGKNITGAHLHYDHEKNQKRVDPQKELDDCE